MKLSLVLGITTNSKLDYNAAYSQAFIKAARAYADDQQDRDKKRRIIFYGVKFLGRTTRGELDYDGLLLRFQAICAIKNLIGELTPLELLQLLPIDKKYNGAKYQSKDYFSTMDALVEHGLNNKIGKDVTKLLWDYTNWDVCNFEVECMSILSAIRQATGHHGLVEEFFESQGKHLTTYTIDKDFADREYVINNDTGESTRIKHRRPRYLHLVND